MNAPPTARALEATIRGRRFTAAPGLAGTHGGPDAVAYRVGACRALEAALGVAPDERTRAARRLLCCAAWIDVHATHVHLVQAAEYLGHPDRASLAHAEPEAVRRGIELHRLGLELADTVGRVGRDGVRSLRPRLQDAVAAACLTVRWVAGFDLPESVLDIPLLALDDPSPTGGSSLRYPLDEGIGVLTTSGLGFPLADFETHISRPRADPAHPTRARLHGVKAVLTGPLARYALCARALRPAARDAARAAGLEPRERDPHRSVLIRAVELVHVLEEAIDLADRFEPPPPTRPLTPRAGHGIWARRRTVRPALPALRPRRRRHRRGGAGGRPEGAQPHRRHAQPTPGRTLSPSRR